MVLQQRSKLGGGASTSSASGSNVVRSSIHSVPNEKWSFATLVVDCIEGTVQLFLNGTSVGTLTTQFDLDGEFSLGEQFTLFGTKAVSECTGGALR